MENNKPKPFKETALGKFIGQKIPTAIDMIGNVLPDKGGLGIIKNIIDRADLTGEDKREGYRLISEMELALERLAVQDRESARNRETEFVKATGHADYMMVFVGIFILAIYAFAFRVVVYIDIPGPNRDLFIHTLGLVEGTVMCICSYYFGSSKGSTEKNRILKGN